MKIATLYIDGKAIDFDMEVLPSEFMLIAEKCRKQAESEKVKVGDKIAIPFGISPQRTVFITIDRIEEN